MDVDHPRKVLVGNWKLAGCSSFYVFSAWRFKVACSRGLGSQKGISMKGPLAGGR